MTGPELPGAVPREPVVDDSAVNIADSTTIFEDEQDVSPTRALVLPLVGALVGVGLLIGAAVGIVAVVTAPAWSIGVGAIAESTRSGGALAEIQSTTGVVLPPDTVVVDSGPGTFGGLDAYVARVTVSTDPAELLQDAGYSAVSDVPRDVLEAEGADFADPRFYAYFVGNDAYTALTGITSDGRTRIVFSAPLAG